MAGLFDSDIEVSTDSEGREVYKRKMKNKKKKKKVTSKDMPGDGIAKKGAETLENTMKRRKAILDAL